MKNKLIWNKEISEYIAKILIENKAYLVHFNKAQKDWVLWSSKVRCPVYLNCRYIYSKNRAFSSIVSIMENMIQDSFKDYDIFVGLSTAGIPLAAAMAMRFSKPFAYVRSKPKDHGIGGLVEGDPAPRLRAIIIDDTLASGGSINSAIAALEEEFDIETVGIATIAAMSEVGFENQWEKFLQKNIPVKVLTNYLALENVAVNLGLMTIEQADKLNKFYKSPSLFTW